MNCPACGGVVGRDCFNPQECMEITQAQAAAYRDGVNHHPSKQRETERAVLSLLAELVDPEPCRYDHHGHCQEHMHLTTETRCPHARAKAILNAQEEARPHAAPDNLEGAGGTAGRD